MSEHRMSATAWIVRDRIGVDAKIIGIGLGKIEAENDATQRWLRKHGMRTMHRENRKGWATLRVAIEVV